MRCSYRSLKLHLCRFGDAGEERMNVLLDQVRAEQSTGTDPFARFERGLNYSGGARSFSPR
jgi:hypothetical protein